MIVTIIILCMLDYVLTYKGIKLNFIFEGNPLMVKLFELSFIKGFLIKLLLIVGMLTPLYYCKHYDLLFYKIGTMILIIAYIYIMVLHTIWIVKYLTKGC